MSCNSEAYYLDYAATTPVDAEVLAAALPFYGSAFFNPSSSHKSGQIASRYLEHAREQCKSAINCRNGNIYFNSGGTEAINWALKCAPMVNGRHIVISAIEHDAVFACAERLKHSGYEVDFAKPSADGIITPEALKNAMRGDTSLVCVMSVNNIVGTVQPIKELAAAAHERGALFFTDAVQAVNSTAIDVEDSGADMLCVSGHKFYAPKGTGFLYVKDGVKLSPFIDGGAQEGGLRGGTVDVAGAVAIAAAVTRAAENVEAYNAHADEVCTAFLSALDAEPIALGAPKTSDIVSVAFDGVNGGRLAVALSEAGVCCSVGSACSAGSATPPKTLVEMGVEKPECAVRFSFGKPTTARDAVAAAEIVNRTVANLRGRGAAK